MIRLMIDGRRIAVPPGTTILGAAQWLGIRIPTMCHVPGIEAAGSCFVCAVAIEGRRNLAPACAMLAGDGMVVSTNSEDVRKARRMALELLLSDHAGECVAPCAARCPAGLDIPGFVAGIAAGDHPHAAQVIGERLALPGSLGRICPRLCEQDCHRCDFDEGLAVGALHRYVADEGLDAPPLPPSTGKSVAIVGAGPAGLAAAYYLLRKGHACTLYDAHPLPGGMLRYGIPAYRLPKDALDREISVIVQLGAQFRTGQRWGEHFTLAQLRDGHDAVFIAIGAQRAQSLGCAGQELAVAGTDFLAHLPPVQGDVIVVGGGNTAVDCARSAIRLGGRSVRVLYRRSRQEMPCLMAEVEAAEAEGVRVELLAAPVKLERHGPRIRLTCTRMALGEPDASGRRRPVGVPGSEYTVECDTVIAAIGQSVDCSLAQEEGLAVSAWGIAAHPCTLATSIPGVFAGGDAVLGADLAVRAVAAGRLAAVSIHQFLSDEPVAGDPVIAAVDWKPLDDAERAAIFRAIEKTPRVPVRQIPLERRLAGFDEVEQGLPAADAAREARRCLGCGCRKAAGCYLRTLATEYGADATRFSGARRRFTRDESHPEIVYEPGKCICCNACARVAAAEGEELGLALVGRGFDVVVATPFGKPIAEGLAHSARRCAAACPTGALALR